MREAVPEDPILISEAFEKVRAIIDPMGGNQDSCEDEWWYRQEQALHFLRLAISEGSLIAFTYDSCKSRTVQLDYKGWTLEQWERLGPDGWYDLEPAENANPPDEDQYDEGYRPIFFAREEFDAWLPSLRAEQAPVEDKSTLPVIAETRGSRKNAVIEALTALTRDGKLPPGISAKTRDARINQWLAENGRDEVSIQSIRRALQTVRKARGTE